MSCFDAPYNAAKRQLADIYGTQIEMQHTTRADYLVNGTLDGNNTSFTILLLRDES